ncbi:MAG TPA: hypothetical protein VFN61_04115, partial [Acidimicrobiales bacterium]|nr:hypothetical protein [Acidimicrobiales bacterium]
SALSVDWSTPVTNADVMVQEFAASTPSTWKVSAQGAAHTPFPSLGAPAGASNLYFAASMAWGNASAGDTPGFTYSLPNRSTMLAWAEGISGTAAPTGTGAGSVGAVFTATPTGATSSVAVAPAAAPTTTAVPTTAVPTTTAAPASTTPAASATPALTVAIGNDGVIYSHSGPIGAGGFSATLSPRKIGDLLVMGVINDTWAVTVTSVSGGGASSWQRAGQPWFDAADGQIMQYWYGTVTSTSATPVKVTFSSGINNLQLMVDEMSGATGWSVSAPVSSPHPFPSIQASGTSAYVGMGFAWGNASTGGTSGVTYKQFSNAFMSAVAAPASGTVSPAGTGAGSLAVLVTASTSLSASTASTTTTAQPATTTTAQPATTTTVAPTTTAPTTTAPTTTSGATPGASGNLVPPSSLMPNSVFNANAQSYPVNPDSGALANDIVAQYEAAYGSVAVNQNRPVYWVPANQPLVNVSVAPGCGNFQPSTGASAPIPSNAVAGTSSDHILNVYQPSTGSAWEYWLAQKTSSGWQACWGGKLSLGSTNGVFAAPYGETASGIANIATEITEADVQSGSINHAIGIEVLGNSCDSGYAWPADRGDCSASGTHPQEGDWFRFPSNLAMPSGLTPFGQMVFRAIQTYGAVVVDQGGAVAIEADSPSSWSAEGHSGTDPITAAMNGQPEYQVVASLPWGSLQHVTP